MTHVARRLPRPRRGRAAEAASLASRSWRLNVPTPPHWSNYAGADVHGRGRAEPANTGRRAPPAGADQHGAMVGNQGGEPVRPPAPAPTRMRAGQRRPGRQSADGPVDEDADADLSLPPSRAGAA